MLVLIVGHKCILASIPIQLKVCALNLRKGRKGRRQRIQKKKKKGQREQERNQGAETSPTTEGAAKVREGAGEGEAESCEGYFQQSQEGVIMTCSLT